MIINHRVAVPTNNDRKIPKPSWQAVKELFKERKYVLAPALVDQLIAKSGLPSEPADLAL